MSCPLREGQEGAQLNLNSKSSQGCGCSEFQRGALQGRPRRVLTAVWAGQSPRAGFTRALCAELHWGPVSMLFQLQGLLRTSSSSLHWLTRISSFPVVPWLCLAAVSPAVTPALTPCPFLPLFFKLPMNNSPVPAFLAELTSFRGVTVTELQSHSHSHTQSHIESQSHAVTHMEFLRTPLRFRL